MKSATDLVTSHEGLDKIDTKILRVLQADGWYSYAHEPCV